MLQTLFHVPDQWLTGLLVIWLVGSLIVLVRLVRKQGFTGDTLAHVFVLGMLGLMIGVVLPALSHEQGLPIRGYGVMLLLAFVSGVALAAWRARRVGLDPEIIVSLSFWMFVGGILGARLFYVIEYWEEFQRGSLAGTISEIVKVTEGGLVVYGAAMGAGAAMLLFVRKHRLPGLALADLAAPSLMLGLALGRVGCFLNGCCFGGVCDLPWAVTFPWRSPAHVRQIERGQITLHGLVLAGDRSDAAIVDRVAGVGPAGRAGVKAGDRIVRIVGPDVDEPIKTMEDALTALLAISAPGSRIHVYVAGESAPRQWTVERVSASLPIHPAQLYSAIDALLLGLLLLAYYPYRRRDGEVLALLITLHPISRFILEIIRTDELAVFGTGLSISQNLSLLLLVAAAGLWIYLARRPPGSVWPVQVMRAP